jgi:hypothetical protein
MRTAEQEVRARREGREEREERGRYRQRGTCEIMTHMQRVDEKRGEARHMQAE